jgi:hypothetical protein
MTFHILGRFAFTSSLSRRSCHGFRVGSRRFGFCCCKRGLLYVFIISIPIHPLFANQSCYLGCLLAQIQRGSAIPHMGPFSPNHMLPEAGDFPHAPPPRQKYGMGGNRVDRALFSRKAVSKATRIRGRKMATIPMIPVGPVTTLHRSILLTERGISGNGGDDFICGHCGSVMLEDFDPSTVRGNPVYQCGFCENNNDLPFAASDGRHWPSR